MSLRTITITFCLFLFSGCSARTHYSYYEEAPLIVPKAPLEKFSKKNPHFMVPFAKDVEGPLVVIDPGHGGKDNGTESVKGPKYYEKHLALSTSLVLCQYLKMVGIKAILTREKDEFIELKDRAQFSNEKKPIAFVSVHFNSAPSTQAEGVEVYYYKSDTDKVRSKNSKLLADKVLDGILTYTKAKSRGVKHGNFLVIRETETPAIIVEGGFMTHEEEMQKIRDASYLKKLAWGMAQGIRKFESTRVSAL